MKHLPYDRVVDRKNVIANLAKIKKKTLVASMFASYLQYPYNPHTRLVAESWSSRVRRFTCGSVESTPNAKWLPFMFWDVLALYTVAPSYHTTHNGSMLIDACINAKSWLDSASFRVQQGVVQYFFAQLNNNWTIKDCAELNKASFLGNLDISLLLDTVL